MSFLMSPFSNEISWEKILVHRHFLGHQTKLVELEALDSSIESSFSSKHDFFSSKNSKYNYFSIFYFFTNSHLINFEEL